MTGSERDATIAEGGLMFSSIDRWSSSAAFKEPRIASLGFMLPCKVAEMLSHTLEDSIDLLR